MKAYISGPMRGIDAFNFPAFNEAAAQLRSEGYEVVNPAETDGGDTSKPFEYYMRQDIAHICDCDMVYVLPGWRNSVGASFEVKVAQVLKIPVVDFDTGLNIDNETVLEEAERIVNGVRRSNYGTPKDNHGRTAAMWSVYLGVPIDARQVCVLNILQKCSRDRNAPIRDNPVDIAGYARNMELIGTI